MGARADRGQRHARGHAVALKGLGHLQSFWRTDLALPPIKRFLATLSDAAWA